MEPRPLPLPNATVLPYSQPVTDRDAGHLRLLAIFHYVYGALAMAISCLFLIHVGIGIWLVASPPKPVTGPPPPPEVGWLFIAMGATAVLCGWVIGGLVIYSGRCIARRRHWTFSVVVAALTCLTGVLGIILAVFTFIVLLRDSVKAVYGVRCAAL